MEKYVKMYMEAIALEKHMSQNTLEAYRRDLLRLCGFLEQNHITDITKVTETNLNSYILQLESLGLSAATVSRCIASMKVFFSYLSEERIISQNIAKGLKAPKRKTKIPEVLTVEEVERLLKQTDGESVKEMRDKAMLELLYATGIRASELISMRLEDVNLQMDYILCVGNEKERVIPIDRVAKEALNRYLLYARPVLAKTKESYLFTNFQGRQLSRQGLWKIMKEYALKAGITKDISPHTLRHSFAYHMVENGADLQSIQAMLGHSDLATTQIYARKKDVPLMEVYQKTHIRKQK